MHSYNFVQLVLLVYVSGRATGGPVYLKKPNGVPASCTMLKVSVLMSIHGGAFNERYMSIRQPKADDSKGGPITIKRAISDQNWNLSVDKGIDEAASVTKNVSYAWEVSHPFDINRLKRGRDRVKAPWDCGETIEWVDLGKEYFPRYLRSVKCSCETCWYNSYQCKPRSFPINVLRKRTDECVPAPEKVHTYLQVKAGENIEAWIWDEQYVNVSCECVFSPK